MEDELVYRIALTLIPDLGPVRIRNLVNHFGSATAIFTARKKELLQVDGIHDAIASVIRNKPCQAEAKEEIGFLQRNSIQSIFLTDANYPQRLLHCYDPPALLYYRGNFQPNPRRIISIIGTRNHTEYGKQVTEEIIEKLQTHEVTIVSGLAYGIDALAHKYALQYQLPTIGVLAHGLDTLYPHAHKSLAKEMLPQGGLLTEFTRGSKPDKHNFPKRNRIVAGISDATIVIETATKGGSMITAELAYQYNRDLFAIPGRIRDTKSSGCLSLIKQNKAQLFTDVPDLLDTLGWTQKKTTHSKPRELFIELSDDEKRIVELLNTDSAICFDSLYIQSGLSSSLMAKVLLSLEIQQVIQALPGKQYKLL